MGLYMYTAGGSYLLKLVNCKCRGFLIALDRSSGHVFKIFLLCFSFLLFFFG